MSAILTSQINVSESTSVKSSLSTLAKETMGILALFACAAVPVLLLSFTWV